MYIVCLSLIEILHHFVIMQHDEQQKNIVGTHQAAVRTLIKELKAISLTSPPYAATSIHPPPLRGKLAPPQNSFPTMVVEQAELHLSHAEPSQIAISQGVSTFFLFS